ncbi:MULTISPECIES: chromate transporter [unclassified Mycoplasma]|uniref:chromate transporter n=1 Tax=unclassified Mycoplasma TaxID=2683645 RepID=UPI00216B3730|nr:MULTISPECIES: chromate transporter [unclassified Mycoplasma]MCS4536965.1 chromate transporter [Mycoplasma sp. CSL7475-4]MCT4469495.1 chromate transporter [Mycoplasma sp. HS2188]
MFIPLLVSIPLIALISLSVFGGGQIFMPIFTWLWNSLSSWFNVNITSEQMSNIFAISNSTPGILSPKFAAITGYLVTDNIWVGIVAMFLTFLAFTVPAILMMKLALKYSDKFDKSTYFKQLLKVMNPVVTAIIVALAIQLFIGLIAPQVVFNKSVKNYAALNYNSGVYKFLFKGWRQIVSYIYIPLGIVVSLYLYTKKAPMFSLILGNVALCFILYQPWFR